MITRRHSLSLLGGSIGITLLPLQAHAEATSPVQLPDPKLFQSGDFVWPKKPGVYVPYISGRPADAAADEASWLSERDRFVADAGRKAPYFTPQAIDRMRNLSFREFYAEYGGAQKPDTPGVYARGGGLYVGHVGVIEVDASQTPWVIDAMDGQGVARHTYTDWLAGRPGEMVWLGWVAQHSEAERAKISTEAKTQLGKPYDFWNFDLGDDTAFYCSKLAWWAIFKSLNF